MDNRGVRGPTACRTCAKAKVKCDPEADGPCKRCRRLNKDCTGQEPGSNRRQRTTNGNSQVAALEQKLDRMVALLAASERSSRERPEQEPSTAQSSSALLDEEPATPNDLEGQILMEWFATRMVHLFPFVVIPSHVTSDELSREKSFLFLNIAMVACQNAARQRELVNAVHRYVAEHVVIRGEHSLDILQGLLVHMAWFIAVSRQPRSNAPREPPGSSAFEQNYYKNKSTAQMDSFIHLAIAQSISLGLNKELAAQKYSNQPLDYVKEAGMDDEKSPIRTLEERRAYLGCYYVTVIFSACVKDQEPVRFTKYIDDCCQILQHASEYATDAYLVHLIRVVHLADRVYHMTSYQGSGSSVALTPPLGLSMHWFQAELQRLKGSFSCDMPHSAILLFHYNLLEILLYRISFNDEVSDTQYGDHPLTRLDLLFRCLESTRSFFHNFYSLPSVYLPFFPFTYWCQLGQAAITLSRLTLYDSPGGEWDRTYVQSTIDFDATIDRLAQKLEEARPFAEQKSPGSDELPEIFGRMTARMQVVKEAHRRRKVALEQSPPDPLLAPLDYDAIFSMPVDAFLPFGEIMDVWGAM
ncbi:hypothetical protein NUU61_008218 [Penicillium alfredii]|uniref:Zn(2)-C6 fungal-type domain-containing protein n=1 Tax=Penicillium alfredii TaxID=1506179 RepID=A0A9W9JZB1_9EURO|nr:uncharacterized protein NUU61_008218 [Penicillium alfredii]KAJ5086911.1 hypothetical protein NUU61_008218 [Penicillium alfredii]